MKANWPKEIPFPPSVLIGSGINSLGSGLGLARTAGALIERMDHQWNYPRGIPDPRYPGMNRALHFNNQAALWANQGGKRFVREIGSSSEILKEMLRQPGGRAWSVFDSNGRVPVRVSGPEFADPKRVDELILGNPSVVHKADTLEELARKAGWPVENFLATIARFNRMVADGADLDFDRFNPLNPPTERVGQAAIPPVEVPPFYAVALYPMTRKSLGGIAVDLECRVLDAQRKPIAGLYAAGEVTGFNGLNGKAGLEGTFLGPSILQGRILGQSLAKLATAHSSTPPAPSAGGPALNQPLRFVSRHCQAGYSPAQRLLALRARPPARSGPRAQLHYLPRRTRTLPRRATQDRPAAPDRRLRALSPGKSNSFAPRAT